MTRMGSENDEWRRVSAWKRSTSRSTALTALAPSTGLNPCYRRRQTKFIYKNFPFSHRAFGDSVEGTKRDQRLF